MAIVRKVSACMASKESSCMHGYTWLLFIILIETGVARGARVRWAVIEWILHRWFRWRMIEQLWSATHHRCHLELEFSLLSLLSLFPFFVFCQLMLLHFKKSFLKFHSFWLQLNEQLVALFLSFHHFCHEGVHELFHPISLRWSLPWLLCILIGFILFSDSSLLLWASAFITCSGSSVLPCCDVP